jgi:hypothetical protein
MKKILGIIFLSLLFSGNAHSVRQDGSGELKISYGTLQSFKAYLRGNTSKSGKSLNNKPMVFWVTVDGTDSTFWYCSHGQCAGSNPVQERRICEKQTGQECFRFARKNSVRWKNGINPGKGAQSKFNAKMSDQEIVAKLTELGFYGNDTSSRIKPKITKKKTKIINDNNSNLAENLKVLKKMFDDGVLTQEEFTKAKKKLLN